MRSAALVYTNQSQWQYISSSIAQWVRNEGRLFPISAIENVLLFSSVHSVAIYKLIQWLILLILVLLIAWFVRLFLGSNCTFPVVVFGVLAALQTRNWYDPTFGFGLLLQSVALKVFLSAILLHFSINGRRRLWWGPLSVIVWIAGLLQYEVVITLLPTLGIVALSSAATPVSRRLLAVLPHFAVSAVFLVISQLLRQGKLVAPAYTTNTDLHEVAPAYARQLSASVPFSAHIWDINPRTVIGATSFVPFLVFVSLAVVGVVAMRKELINNPLQKRKIGGLFVIGLNLVLGPGLPTSLSVRWQSELSWGLGYLPVFLQYLGVALVVVSAVLWFGSPSTRGLPRRYLFAGVLAFCTVSATANRALLIENVRAQEPARWNREFYESSVRLGFFDQVPAGSFIQSSLSDPNSWISNYFTAWLGGPKDLTFVRSGEERANVCEAKNCQKRTFFQLDPIKVSGGRHGLLLREVMTDVSDRHTSDQIVDIARFRIVQPNDFWDPCPPTQPTARGHSVTIFDCIGDATSVLSQQGQSHP